MTRFPYLQFLGAAGTVTGSKHLVNLGGYQVLVDCGLFQGQKEWRERNWQDTPIPAREIDAVILTHAHIDHSGWVPRLVRAGFRGSVYATPPTVDLCAVMLPDSAHLQEEDAAFHNKRKSSRHRPALPLYTVEQAEASLERFTAVEFGRTLELHPGLSFRYLKAGHILGSAMVEMSVRVNGATRRLLFSGDIGRMRDDQIAPGAAVPPQGPADIGEVDLVVMESTYGNRLHPTTDPRPELARLLRQTAERGGSVVVPAFAVERTQKFLFLLKELMESGDAPRLPVHSDSPLAIKAMQIFMKHQGEFTENTRRLVARYGSPLEWDGFSFALRPEESKKINDSRYPCVIVSSSGMATGGRILHHLLLRLPDPRNTVLFIGFQAPGTRGALIKGGADTVKIFGEQVPIRAQVAALEQFSDHADTPELLEWLRTFDRSPASTWLVHGEPAASSALQETITRELKWKVHVAEWLQKVPLS